MDEFPQILAIFYAEFHITQGSQVLFEVPEGFTNSMNDGPLKVDFDSFSEYMIPKSALCNQLVTISTTNLRIMGFPVLLQDSKYERNALLFNLCFVFEKTANILSFEQIVTKIARVLRALEVESEFLSNPETKSTLPNIITQIMEDLNAYHECQISVNDANRIDLKLFPVHSEPPLVYDYQVPILITDLTKYIDRHWDITMRRIIDFVNGVNTVHKIAYKSDVDITYVRIAIQHLLYYGCAKLIDIFQKAGLIGTKIIPVLVDLQQHKIASGDNKGADFYKINPKGNVPTLVLEDGTVLNENAAVLQYIADLAPTGSLAPANGTNARYLLQSKLSYVGSEVHPNLNPLFYPMQEDAKTWVFDRLSSKVDFLNKVELKGRKFLVGDSFTVVDAYLYILLYTFPYISLDLAKYPEVERYYKGIAELDFVKESHHEISAFQ
ncbi:Nitrogen permease regulator 2 [Boothiomyces sp. JEL0866]|nr:Nitrogen permease regulator 2 [Boothiomyces sp. JEL0866]